MTQIPPPDTASADRPEYDKLRGDKTRQIAPRLVSAACPTPEMGTGPSSIPACQARPTTSDPPRKNVVVAGQGEAMHGPEMRAALQQLARKF